MIKNHSNHDYICPVHGIVSFGIQNHAAVTRTDFSEFSLLYCPWCYRPLEKSDGRIVLDAIERGISKAREHCQKIDGGF